MLNTQERLVYNRVSFMLNESTSLACIAHSWEQPTAIYGITPMINGQASLDGGTLAYFSRSPDPTTASAESDGPPWGP